MGYQVQHVRIGFDTSHTGDINIMKGGNSLPENVVMQYLFNANIDAEDLNVTGYTVANPALEAELVTTEIAGSAGATGVVDLSDAAKGYWKLRFVVDTTVTGEYVDIWVITW